jgi:hypothetical protein
MLPNEDPPEHNGDHNKRDGQRLHDGKGRHPCKEAGSDPTKQEVDANQYHDQHGHNDPKPNRLRPKFAPYSHEAIVGPASGGSLRESTFVTSTSVRPSDPRTAPRIVINLLNRAGWDGAVADALRACHP